MARNYHFSQYGYYFSQQGQMYYTSGILVRPTHLSLYSLSMHILYDINLFQHLNHYRNGCYKQDDLSIYAEWRWDPKTCWGVPSVDADGITIKSWSSHTNGALLYNQSLHLLLNILLTTLAKCSLCIHVEDRSERLINVNFLIHPSPFFLTFQICEQKTFTLLVLNWSGLVQVHPQLWCYSAVRETKKAMR